MLLEKPVFIRLAKLRCIYFLKEMQSSPTLISLYNYCCYSYCTHYATFFMKMKGTLS